MISFVIGFVVGVVACPFIFNLFAWVIEMMDGF